MRQSASASGGAAVTPDDATANVYNCLWIGTAGDGTLKVTTEDGSVLSFVGVTAGFFPISTTLVWDTGTGVSDIVGLHV